MYIAKVIINLQVGANTNSPLTGAKRPQSGAKRPGGETSRGRNPRNVLVAKRLGGETARGRNVQGAKRPVKGRNVHKPLKAPSLMDQRRSRGATGQE